MDSKETKDNIKAEKTIAPDVAIAWIQSHADDLLVPILILHGGADRVALPEGIRVFFEKISFLDKERYEYP